MRNGRQHGEITAEPGMCPNHVSAERPEADLSGPLPISASGLKAKSQPV